MRKPFVTVALPAVLMAVLTSGTVHACPFAVQASQAPIVVADNAPTSTPAPGSTSTPDTVAFPNSPNGSPATTNKGAPVVTDQAACSGTGAAQCPDKPAPSAKADTSDVKIATPTTVDGSAKP